MAYDLTNIADVNPSGMREVQLELKPLAYFLGFNQASLTNQVRQGFFGGQAQRLQHGKDELRVWVRYPKTDRISISSRIKASPKVTARRPGKGIVSAWRLCIIDI